MMLFFNSTDITATRLRSQENLGHNVAVNASNLQYVSRVEVMKTCTLCQVVFTCHKLATSSTTVSEGETV